MIISHNLPALAANNDLAANITGLAKASEKLSSGYRINRAADDAAGLAVSEKMRSQIRGLNQAVRNAQDGISYTQTAEGVLGSMHEILRRCKELALESANGTYDNSVDRAAIQLEFSQLCDEIDHEAMTDFNGKLVFDTTGATPPDAFGNGAAADLETKGAIDIKLVKVTLNDGTDVNFSITFNGITDIDEVSYEVNNYNNFAKLFGDPKVTADKVKAFAAEIDGNILPNVLGSLVANLPNSSVPSINGLGIGFNLYDGGANNVLAFVRSNGTSFSLQINTNYLETDSNGNILVSNDLIGTIAHEMMHAVMFDTVSNGMLGIDPVSHAQNNTLSFPAWFTEGMAETVGGGIGRLTDIMGKNNVDTSLLTSFPSSNFNKDVSITQIQSWMSKLTNNYTETSISYAQGYAACMYLGYLAGGGKNLATDVNSTVIAQGLDNILTDIAAGHSLDSTIAHYTGKSGIKDFINNIGSADVAQFVNQLIKSANITVTPKRIGTSNSYQMTIPSAGSVISRSGLSGGADTITGTADYFFQLDVDNDTVDNRDLILAGTGNTFGGIYEGGNATTNGNDRDGNTPPATFTGLGADGTYGGGTVNPNPPNPPNPPDPPDPPDPPGPPDPPNPPDPPGPTNPTDPSNPSDPNNPGGSGGSFGLSNATLILQLGARSKDAIEFTFKYESNGIGDLKNDLCCTSQGLGLDKLSLADQNSANNAIDKIDHAINKVSLIRASFGAVSNRLEHKIANLTNVSEALTEAESSIRDADMAGEMMNYTKFQILQNTAQTMLAQANQMPQSVLSLLG